MLVYQYSNSAIDKKGDKTMSEWLREAIEADRYEDVDVYDAPDISDAYADYISADDYE